MKNLNRTHWFDPSERPYREGYYERNVNNIVGFAYWDTVGWSYTFVNFHDVVDHVNDRGANFKYSDYRGAWRGLTSKQSYKIQPELHHAESRDHYECHTG